MIARSRILSYLIAMPFQPFRIQMPSGKTMDVMHPEMARLERSELRVFVAASRESPTQADSHCDLSILLMESIGPIEPGKPAAVTS